MFLMHLGADLALIVLCLHFWKSVTIIYNFEFQIGLLEQMVAETNQVIT